MDTPRDKPIDQLTEADLIKIAFGDALVRRRYQAGFGNRRERYFSRVAGISISHLRSIENGQISPSITTLWKLATALDTSPADMLTETSRLLDLAPQTLIDYDPREE